MKNYIVVFATLLFGFSFHASADVSCESAKITEILVYKAKVVVKQGSRYRSLGMTSSAYNQDKMLSLVLAAKAMGSEVILVYSDGYDCSRNNYSAQPLMVIQK